MNLIIDNTESTCSRRRMKLFVGLAAVVVVLLATGGQQAALAGPAKVKDFRELLTMAQGLESAKELLAGEPKGAGAHHQRPNDGRDDRLARFAREVKSAQCARHFEQLNKVVDEYRVKAYNFVADSKKSNNWFGNFMKAVAGPLGAMKGLAKFDDHLNGVTQRYEAQSKDGQLSDEDVNCDMAKFQIKSIEAIMFVLRTDIKYLVLEDPQILNQEIRAQLKQDNFVSSNNFYEIEHLTPRQSDLVLEFYNSRVDSANTSVGEAKRHFHEPGSLIIGRLLDSCHAMLHYKAAWHQLEAARQEDCSKSRSDPKNNLFSSLYKLDKYEDVALFCQQLFDAL